MRPQTPARSSNHIQRSLKFYRQRPQQQNRSPPPTMLSTARSKGLNQALSSTPSVSIPSFLLPAFPITSRSFSASTCRNSHIGSAALSIPPEVNFTVIPPPPPARGSAVLGKPVVKIEGPLGKLSMSIEPFIRIEHDTAIRKAFVSVEDREKKNQRAMWGQHNPPPSLVCL